jgi:predicted permease
MSLQLPPRLARWLLERAVPPDVREDVAGDLTELFHRDTSAEGSTRARARYWRHAISCAIRFGAERCRNALRAGLLRMPWSRPQLKAALSAFMGWRLDLTLAIRMLLRYPALSGVAVLGIAVAIALAATMVTIIGEQLNPSDPPLPEGGRIVALQRWDAAKHRVEPLTLEDMVAWREQLSQVRNVGAFRNVTRNLIVPPAVPEPVGIAEMSAAGFDVAGVAPLIGRALQPEDERASAAPVVVIGYAEWRRRFGASPDVLTRSVQLGDSHHAVVGVMPEGFAFPINHTYWIPLRREPAGESIGLTLPPVSVFGRLAPGATLQSAQEELTMVGDRTPSVVVRPESSQAVRTRLVPYARQFPEADDPGNRLAMQVVRFLVAVLLAVVSINIAVLVYARTAARQPEIAVRTALGASRGRIVTQLFGEGLVLAGLGSVAGIMAAVFALGQIHATFSQNELMPFWVRFDLSGQTIATIVAFTVAIAAVIGAWPAWRATDPRVQHRLQTLSAGGGAGMHLGRLWTLLILFQVAFAVALLPFVVVRMSELARDGMGRFGFEAREFLLAQVAMDRVPSGSVESSNLLAGRYRQMENRIREIGNIRATAFSSSAPGFESAALLRSDTGAMDASVRVNRVSPDFFQTWGVALLAGRDFRSADAAPDARTVIVNRAFARGAANGAAALGSHVRAVTSEAQAVSGLANDWYEIVGIVDDFPLPSSRTLEPEPKVYRAITSEAEAELTMTLRLYAGDGEPWGTRLRQLAAGIDPTLQVKNVVTMDELLRQQQRPARLLAGVLAAMTVSVLLLSAAGIYALMAFSVTQRRREIGIRLALGAGTRRILLTIFSRAAGQLLAGAAAGTAVAAILDRAGGGLMRGHAAIAISAVVALLIIVGLLAALRPARQGLRIAPTEALRGPTR